jgi:[ribosomal protein S5]-alanine N-acetyltransferase
MGETLCLAVTHTENGSLLGTVSLSITPEDEAAELGFWLGTPFWNKGYCTEAAAEVVRYGFEELRLRRVYGRHLGSNPASGRVMQKLGMRREGLLREHVEKWGRFEVVAQRRVA